MAGVLDVCSNHCIDNFNPGHLKKLAVPGDRVKGSSKTPLYRAQALAKRLSAETIADLVRRAGEGESARSLAAAHDVAPSAMTKLLRENGVVVTNKRLTGEQKWLLTQEYEAGATMRELEAKHGLSHGAVLRALHHSGAEMRAKAPRAKN